MTYDHNRPPDISHAMELPTDQTLENLRHISETHPDPAVRTLAVVLFKLCPSVDSIAKSLPGIAAGNVVSLDPDV